MPAHKHTINYYAGNGVVEITMIIPDEDFNFEDLEINETTDI